MFKLYYIVAQSSPILVYSNENLNMCLRFMCDNKYDESQCVIISPNNRKITFYNNTFTVDGVSYSHHKYSA